MPERSKSHFSAYAASQVTDVEPTVAGPSLDPEKGLSRGIKKWGTQMYSNGYICRYPNRKDVMHHYDMNLNFIDELLWHFEYDADTAFMRKMWPVLTRHLAWEKRCFDPDDDGLYDAYCCIWASDALYYNSGAVTHSSAYNYRGFSLAARIAEILGEDSTYYKQEAAKTLRAMNQRLWLEKRGYWAEYQDFMGLKRTHDHAALWSIYIPIDCGACTPQQAFQATQYVDSCIPHIPVRWEKENLPSTLNSQLSSLNSQLSESNRVKEEYIGRFMSLCSQYIDKLDDYRKMVNKKMKNKELEDLFRMSKSTELKEKELEELYQNFDSVFLHLFPNFVNDFNALLQPEQQIHPKEDNRLTTEIRIFALIRLGIEDSSKIAEFLHYSVNTIYNYRARIKNGALDNRESFERRIKQLGNIQ